MQEWKLFHNIYISKFRAADTDGNLRLNSEELVEGLKDINGADELISNSTLWELVVNDLSGRHGTTADWLDFHEYVVVRSTLTAWAISSGMRDSIGKEELLDVALKVYPHFNAYEG